MRARQKNWIAACLLVLCTVSGNALAGWKGKGEVGASFASGNSENESANAALEMKHTRDKWTNTLGLAGNYGSDGAVTTVERWEVRAHSDYAFAYRAYWFGAGRYEDDRFSAFEYQASVSSGLGYKFINTERTKFWVQGGPGYRFAEQRDTGESEDGVIMRGDVGFEHQLTDTTKIVDRLLTESGSGNTYMQNDLGLEVTITGSLGLRVGYQVRHNTAVLPGVEKTDTLATVVLLYETK
jgi:putative salt-induced outer membrane protein